ncbi:MAG: hypothetical protein CH6_4211 [Candidatus Kapaibacterium sp.]|nr:MAG: hypothetical protein CH6_4211 [Candidatus Kapabacteria bacterium]
MKKPFFLLFVVCILLFSCSKEKYSSEEKKFMKTYKEILVARYTFTDSVKANQEVNKILKRNGFTLREFLNFSWNLRMKDTKKFQEMMDSIKNEASREVIDALKKEIQTR